VVVPEEILVVRKAKTEALVVKEAKNQPLSLRNPMLSLFLRSLRRLNARTAGQTFIW